MPDFAAHVTGFALLVVVGFCAFVGWLSYRTGYRDGYDAGVENGLFAGRLPRSLSVDTIRHDSRIRQRRGGRE